MRITTRHLNRKKRSGPRSAGRQRDAAPSTRVQILEAAYRTLVHVGYNQISMRKIADEAGVNQSLLHYYYGSKENLMLEVLGYVNERLLDRQRSMYTEAGSFEKIWAKALEFFKEDVRTGYVRALWELRAQGLSNKQIEHRLAEIIGRWRDLVHDLAKQAIAEYKIQAPLNPVVLGRLMGDLYWGAEAEILAGEDPETHFEAIRLIGNLFRWLARDEREEKRREASAADS